MVIIPVHLAYAPMSTVLDKSRSNLIILLTVAKLKASLAKVENAIDSCHACHFRQPYCLIYFNIK